MVDPRRPDRRSNSMPDAPERRPKQSSYLLGNADFGVQTSRSAAATRARTGVLAHSPSALIREIALRGVLPQ